MIFCSKSIYTFGKISSRPIQISIFISDDNTPLVKFEDSSWNMNLTMCKTITETDAADFLNDRTDRKIKYGIGTVRLSLLMIIFYWVENRNLYIFTVLGIRYGLFGIGGGLLNLHILASRYELLILCVLISNFVHECVYCSSSSRRTILFLYLLKTVIGDAFAGKLDNVIWFKSFVIVLIVWTVLSSQRIISLLVLPNILQVIEMFYQELFIFGSHLFFHWLCEMGDNRYEKYVFFRHRYSYEISCVILYLIGNKNNNDDTLSSSTLLLFADMFASLLYRVTNYICLYSI